MPVSKDLFLAILSLDSYNRGYNSGLAGGTDGLGSGVGTSIGTASIIDDIVSAGIDVDSFNAGFYAIAYNTSYGTVISYRGTDNLSNLNPWSDAPGGDVWNSYGQGIGTSMKPQSDWWTAVYLSKVERVA